VSAKSRIYEDRDQYLRMTLLIVLEELCGADLLRGMSCETQENCEVFSNYRNSNFLDATQKFVLFHVSSGSNGSNKN
jgi:hypothetical protein